MRPDVRGQCRSSVIVYFILQSILWSWEKVSSTYSTETRRCRSIGRMTERIPFHVLLLKPAGDVVLARLNSEMMSGEADVGRGGFDRELCHHHPFSRMVEQRERSSTRRSTSEDRREEVGDGQDNTATSSQVNYARSNGSRNDGPGRRSRREESRSPRRFTRLRQMRIASLSPTPTLVQRREDRSRSRVSRFSGREQSPSHDQRSNSRTRRSSQADGRQASSLSPPLPPQSRRRDASISPAPDARDVDLERAQQEKPKKVSRSESDVISSLFPYPISHFLGHRKPEHLVKKEHSHIKPFPSIVPSIVHRIPQPIEHAIWMFIGAFVGMAIVQLVFTRPRHFTSSSDVPPHVWASPIIIGSFGASSVLLYAMPFSPLSQPRPFIGGQFVSALAGVAITRLFKLAGPTWYDLNDTDTAHSIVWLCGAVSVALSLCLMTATGTLHPPGGATAVLCATNVQVERLSWRVLPVVLLSSVLMVVWNLVWMNLGRKRYPTSFIAGAPATAADGNLLAFLYEKIIARRAEHESSEEHGPKSISDAKPVKKDGNDDKGRREGNAVWQDESDWRRQTNGVTTARADQDKDDAGALRTPITDPHRPAKQL